MQGIPQNKRQIVMTFSQPLNVKYVEKNIRQPLHNNRYNEIFFLFFYGSLVFFFPFFSNRLSMKAECFAYVLLFLLWKICRSNVNNKIIVIYLFSNTFHTEIKILCICWHKCCVDFCTVCGMFHDRLS